jgi:RND family efflux transporter MFP subunit
VPVRVALADETDFPHKGAIDFTDNVVDPNTGTLKVRGIIPNPTPRVLSPGLFVRVRLLIGAPHELLGVPEQAIGTDQGRKFVYVVNDNNEVVEKPVTTGALADNGLRVITEGLRPGERVIVSGLQRVRQGAKVSPRVAEENDAEKKPTTGSKNETPPTPRPVFSTPPSASEARPEPKS